MSTMTVSSNKTAITKYTASAKASAGIVAGAGGVATPVTTPAAIATNRVAHSNSKGAKRPLREQKAGVWIRQAREDNVSPQERAAIESNVAGAVRGVETRLATVATDVVENTADIARIETEIAMLAQLIRSGKADGNLDVARPTVEKIWTKLGLKLDDLSWEHFQSQIGAVISLLSFTDRLQVVRRAEKAGVFKTGTPVWMPMGAGTFAGLTELMVLQTKPSLTGIPAGTNTYVTPDYKLPAVPFRITVRGKVRTSAAYKNVVKGTAADLFFWSGTWLDVEVDDTKLYDKATNKWTTTTLAELITELFGIPSAAIEGSDDYQTFVKIELLGEPDIVMSVRNMLQLAGIRAVTGDGLMGAAAGYVLNKLTDYLIDGTTLDAMAALPGAAPETH